jgi:citrate lyase beta subunit
LKHLGNIDTEHCIKSVNHKIIFEKITINGSSVLNYLDLDGLQRYSEQGASMGFTGKQCIHPGQVQIVQQAFSPSKEKIEWATELVKAFEQHQSSGKVM